MKLSLVLLSTYLCWNFIRKSLNIHRTNNVICYFIWWFILNSWQIVEHKFLTCFGSVIYIFELPQLLWCYVSLLIQILCILKFSANRSKQNFQCDAIRDVLIFVCSWILQKFYLAFTAILPNIINEFCFWGCKIKCSMCLL